jgi:GNAT superfamily N-acetyltransferase
MNKFVLYLQPQAQGWGVASLLVAAAERRLAEVCDTIQIEYNYKPNHLPSQHLEAWYEGKLGLARIKTGSQEHTSQTQ